MSKLHATADSVKASPAKQKKIDIVTSLTDKADKSKVMVFADYRGIAHKQLEELRHALKKVDGEFMVTKNRLIKRALGDKAQSVEDALKESTAIVFAYGDEVAPLKELLKFFKDSGAGSAKAGLMGDSALTDKEVSRLASLPSREILLGMLAAQLQAPIRGLHYALSWNMNRLVWALNAVKQSKG